MKGLTFDQVERYRGAAMVLELLRESAPKPSILDIGGYFKTLAGEPALPCHRMLENCNCSVVDTVAAELPGYSPISPDQPLPFDDNAFELTLCMDVFEHIHPTRRSTFLDEALRVTSNVLLLGAPFYHDLRIAADRWLADYHKVLLNSVNPMLQEHLENGLPEMEAFLSNLKKRGLEYTSFMNGDLGKWRLVMAVKHLLQLSSGPEAVMNFEYELLPLAEPVCITAPGYRDMVVIFKNPNCRTNSFTEGLTQIHDEIREKKSDSIRELNTIVSRYLEFSGKTILEFSHIHAESLSRLYEQTLSLTKLHRTIRLLQNELDNAHIQLRKQDMSIRIKDNCIQEKDAYINSLVEQSEQMSCKMMEHLKDFEKGLHTVKNSASFRTGQIILAPLKFASKLFRKTASPHFESPVESLSEFVDKIKTDQLIKQKQAAESIKSEQLDSRIQLLDIKHLFSILMPVYATEEKILRAALDSVLAQRYPFWELCIVDDASPDDEPRRIIQEYAEKDPARVRFLFSEVNGGIAVATNRAAQMAKGEFVCLLDHDDLLDPDALMEIALQLKFKPDTDYFYSDEDKVNMEGDEFSQPFYKPDFDPDLLLCNNYLNHFSVIRRSLFESVGGFREGFDGSQDYDLYLRVTEQARRIVHIPKILYHWRMVPDSTAVDPEAKGGLYRESSIKALQAAIERRCLKAHVENGLSPGSYRVKYQVEKHPKVCIIIPTRNAVDLLSTCITSIEKHTVYPNYEILVVDNDSDDTLLLSFLEKMHTKNKMFRSIRYPGRFNFSSINNYAVQHTDAEVYLFLNNDIEATQSGWLTAMMEHGQREEVGVVGAKLLYPNGLIQHAGVILGMGGIAGHPFKGMQENNGVYFGHSNMVKNYSAVTAACLLTRKDVFEEAGGFNEELAVSFGDIDLCMEIRRRGYRIIYTPYARLIHHESISRLDDNDPVRRPRFNAEITYMQTKWGNSLYEDPYLNPNLSILEYDMRLRSEGEHKALENFRKAFSGFIPGME